MQFDIETSHWEALLENCDLIHLRLMLGSIQTDLWPCVYENVREWVLLFILVALGSRRIRHLAPGGTIEHVEIDWTPRWGEDSDEPAEFKAWSALFLDGMAQFERNASVTIHGAERLMKGAGFTDFREEIIPCYVNPSGSDPHQDETSEWLNLALCSSLEDMSLRPMIEKKGMAHEAVQGLCARVTTEVCTLRYHAYLNLYAVLSLGFAN